MPPARVGHYRLVDHLATGGMGEVFRAWDERLERWVAIKQIRLDSEDSQGHQRFRREARATARLSHPAIVRIHDVLESADGDWIVMELIEGETLSSLLADGPLPLERGLALASQIASGLSAAHARGIIHRDLKAENVMVTSAGPAGRAKLLDFGLAKRFRVAGYDPSDPDTWKSAAGRIVGTSRAMSPEQAQGRAIDPRSDLFSLGTLFFEMFTGTSPFKGASHIDTLNRVCTHQQPLATQLNPALPRRLAELIDRLLEKNPDRRPQSADEVVVALDAISVGEREISETRPLPVVPAAPLDEPTRPGRPVPPGRRATEERLPLWRRLTLPVAVQSFLESLHGRREDSRG